MAIYFNSTISKFINEPKITFFSPATSVNFSHFSESFGYMQIYVIDNDYYKYQVRNLKETKMSATKDFIESQFGHCLLVWVFHDRTG